jgi:hypothetical protein
MNCWRPLDVMEGERVQATNPSTVKKRGPRGRVLDEEMVGMIFKKYVIVTGKAMNR